MQDGRAEQGQGRNQAQAYLVWVSELLSTVLLIVETDCSTAKALTTSPVCIRVSALSPPEPSHQGVPHFLLSSI